MEIYEEAAKQLRLRLIEKYRSVYIEAHVSVMDKESEAWIVCLLPIALPDGQIKKSGRVFRYTKGHLPDIDSMVASVSESLDQ